MKIPIIQLVDVVSFFALIFATVQIWRRYFHEKRQYRMVVKDRIRLLVMVDEHGI